MKRGEIWTVAGGGDYTGKARPVVIIQENLFDEIGSVTVCAFTTAGESAPIVRPEVEPTPDNGLRASSRIMVDKITAVRQERLRTLLGRLGDEDMVRLNRAIALFLGLATPSRPASSQPED